MGRLARWASLSLGTHLTPLERASALRSIFPDLAGALATIAAAYTADCYSWPSPSGRWSQGQQAEFKRARWALAAAALPLVPEHLLEQASARLRASWRRL
jgi:hypothetical protein